jgi:HK97 family phage prohead protease
VGDDGVVRGYWAVYDQPTTLQDQYPGTESIARGAFDGLLDGDVIATYNHDFGALLGRTGSGTLRLGSDDHGATFELDMPDTQLGNDVRTMVRRGDLTGASFTAYPGKVERVEGGVVHRQFQELLEVSIVPIPAYAGTMVRKAARQRSLREQLIKARHRARSSKEGQKWL